MYVQGCVGFEMYCATNDQDQKLLDEVHVQVRKNTAGAAIKTRDYTLSIQSCDKVLDLIPGDTKSLYRRALANWRLGEIEKSSEDLEAVLKTKVNDYQEVFSLLIAGQGLGGLGACVPAAGAQPVSLIGPGDPGGPGGPGGRGVGGGGGRAVW